jgi:hypothetical protein
MAITVVGEFAVFAGYSSMNKYMALGMRRAGADVRIHPHYLDLGQALARHHKSPDWSSHSSGGPTRP